MKRMTITRIEPKTSYMTLDSHDIWATDILYSTLHFTLTLCVFVFFLVGKFTVNGYVKVILLEAQKYCKI